MKKTAMILATLLLVSALVAGCGAAPAGGAPAEDKGVTGTWVMTGAEAAGVAVPAEGLSALGEMSIEFKADGNATFSVMGQSGDAKYTEDGDKISIEGGLEIVKEGDALVINEETSNTKLIFTRK